MAMEGEIEEEEGVQVEAEISPALISVHPLEKCVVVAVGSDLRVFDLEGHDAISVTDDSGGPPHKDDIRAVCFGGEGSLFASAANDKEVKVWATDSWSCIRTVKSDKRVCSIAISHDSRFILFADKFGVVWVFSLIVGDVNSSTGKDAAPFFGHYCSIITSLKYSPNGQYVASADRDFKIRITSFPKKPLQEAHEIQSFCLGHTDYVSCLSFINAPNSDQAFLLSGSGDSTVRLWDFLSGCLLDTCEIGLKVGLLGPDQEGKTTPVNDLCSHPDGSLIAVAVWGLKGVALLTCDITDRRLSFAKVVTITDAFTPTSLAMSSTRKRIWTVMGGSDRKAEDRSTPARVKVIEAPAGEAVRLLEESEAPGGKKMLEGLQGKADLSGEELTVAASAAEAITAIRNLLVKRQFSVEDRETRKKGRGDRKHKERYN